MAAWLTTSPSTPHAGRFGPLERRVLNALWQRAEPASVRDLQPVFSDIAYTTLMTTLERLHRKRVLDRTKSGRAFLYQTRLTRAEFESARAADALRTALDGGGGALALSYLVDTVGERDKELLDELEALVRARRAEIGDRSR